MSLIDEAMSLGINVSMYNLLPREKREEALKKDIAIEKKLREEVQSGEDHESQQP